MSYILINLAQEPKNYDSLSSGEAVILAGILAASALSLIPAQKAINFNNARLNGALKFAPVRWHEVVITLIGLLLMISYFGPISSYIINPNGKNYAFAFIYFC